MTQFTDKEIRYQAAVRLLNELGYDLTDLYRQHQERVDVHETGKPTALDEKYALRVPISWAPHFEQGEPELSCFNIRVGGQFKLTPGQRKVLRDLAGLTPTRTITITNLELYPNTNVVRLLTICSNVHVPEHNRKHVLYKWTITHFGDFMERAYLAEVEIRDVKAKEEKESTTATTKKPKTLEDLYGEYV